MGKEKEGKTSCGENDEFEINARKFLEVSGVNVLYIPKCKWIEWNLHV